MVFTISHHRRDDRGEYCSQISLLITKLRTIALNFLYSFPAEKSLPQLISQARGGPESLKVSFTQKGYSVKWHYQSARINSSLAPGKIHPPPLHPPRLSDQPFPPFNLAFVIILVASPDLLAIPPLMERYNSPTSFNAVMKIL